MKSEGMQRHLLRSFHSVSVAGVLYNFTPSDNNLKWQGLNTHFQGNLVNPEIEFVFQLSSGC